MKRPRLTLLEIMAAVGSTSLALAGIHSVAPGRVVPGLIVIGPFLGILWDRRRGGRGILGGLLGGLAYAAACLIYFFSGPQGSGSASPSTMPNWPVQLVFMTAVCVGFGTLMGVVVWFGTTLWAWVFPPALE